MTDKELEKQGQEIKQKLFDLSKDILNTAPHIDKMVEFFTYCCQQAIHQIDHTRTKQDLSFKDQLSSIKEWSINLSNFALSITAMTTEIETEVNNSDNKFSMGYGTWATPVEYIRKQLNESCNKHFKRLKENLHVIDSLRQLYVEIACIKFQDTGESILTDDKINHSVKLFFKNQFLLNFMLNSELHLISYEQYYQELKNSVNN